MKPKKILSLYIYIYILIIIHIRKRTSYHNCQINFKPISIFKFSNSFHNLHPLDFHSFLDELRNEYNSTTTNTNEYNYEYDLQHLSFPLKLPFEMNGRAARGAAPSTASIRHGQRRVGSRVFGEAHARHLSTRFNLY